MTDTIDIHGARQNNLQDVTVSLPRGRLTVVTGVSGSGKSSLAFDTLYAEGQRRYVESFSTYARQFLERMDRPDVDRIDGLLPAVALEQKNTIRSSRSTLGTLTEVTDYLKVLYARLADLHCPHCGEIVTPDHPGAVGDALLAAHPGARVLVTFPFRAAKGKDGDLAARFLRQQGYHRVVRKHRVESLDDADTAPLSGDEHLLVDRLVLRPDEKSRLIESIETAYRLSDGLAHIHIESDGWRLRPLNRDRRHCGETFDAPSEGLFSFNSPLGACDSCKGFGRVLDIDMDRVVPDRRRTLARGAIEPWSTDTRAAERRALREACEQAGIALDVPFDKLPAEHQRFILDGGKLGKTKHWRGVRGWFKLLEQKTYKMHVRIFLSHYRAYVPCQTCDGTRFKPTVRRWQVAAHTLPQVLALPVTAARAFIHGLPPTARSRALAPITSQLENRLAYLEKVGLGYLTLDRQARTLSGGEVQRANLTTTLGSGLVNTLFVLDEPTVGLHAEDSDRLADALAELVARDNTVVVVEHDPDMLRVADHLVELGPGPGRDGGKIVYAGPPEALRDCPASPTASSLKRLATPRKAASLKTLLPATLSIRNARAWNLKGFDVHFPISALSVITGVSGSGKSTLLEDVLYRNILRQQGKTTDPPGPCDAIVGLEHFSDVVWIDQSPPQASSRANPVTYVGAWDHFRALFARTDDARARGYTPTTFSFNAGDGRCPACEGSGAETVEMQFLADVHLACEVCEGKRFKNEILEIRWNGRSVADVLGMTVDEAVPLLNPKLQATGALRSLQDVGLGYLRLGQPLATLSGGEAQRLKLAEHLASSKRHILFLLDEPTTGLHLQDVDRLVGVLRRLVETHAHTVLCIEHHLDVIAAADHVIDLGPGGGELGGSLLFSGPPSKLAKADTATGRHLARWLSGVDPLARSQVSERAKRYRARVPEDTICVEGARTHNLKGIDVSLPRSGRTVVSGVSGSGKSTLVFDIIFAEGQRRFLDCLSAYARQYIEQLGKPEADRIEGIPPTVAIEQRTTRGGSRSNVANVTEIEPFLRILWARLGQIPGAGVSGGLTLDALQAHLAQVDPKTPLHICAPIVQARQGLHLDVLKRATNEGLDVVVNGIVANPREVPRLKKRLHHDIDFVIGKAAPRSRQFRQYLEEAARLGKSQIKVLPPDGAPRIFQVVGVGLDDAMGRSESGFDPRYFSARTKLGRCEPCEGWGILEDGTTCAECGGCRLGPIGRSVLFGERTFPEILTLTAPDLVTFLESLPLDKRARLIAEGPLKAIRERAQFLVEVGLGYLGLDRAVRSLSGGEAQRIRLAAQLGAHLSGVLYVLDEPTIGLHPTDTEKLLKTLDDLERRGNGILMVEHDETTLRTADVLIDIGPGAGVEGGEVLAQGPLEAALNNPRSITGRCLAAPRARVRPEPRPLEDADWLEIRGIDHHTLSDVDVKVPRGRLTVVTGVSGSGKSSLVEVLTKAIASDRGAGEWRKATGTDGLETLVEIDDQPIGKNPRSTPATYVGVWDDIRTMFAALPESKVRAYDRGRFSFNVAGGRCEACAGAGLVTLEMSFLPEAYVACNVCGGTRYSPQTLQVRWENHSIHDVLQMPVREALAIFDRVPKIKTKLELLDDVGLGYLTLGQGSPTLSGGEAQRIKLVTHLAGRGQPKTVLILDEPSIGLHMADVPKLLEVLHRLVDRGATVIVVEHNADIMREADWLIDMGPGPGKEGGKVVYQGPYEGLLEVAESKTGAYLAKASGESHPAARDPKARSKPAAKTPTKKPRASRKSD
jgi:excinuclease ABC subunit A